MKEDGIKTERAGKGSKDMHGFCPYFLHLLESGSFLDA